MTEKFVGRVHLLVTIMIVKVIFTTYDIIGVLYIYIFFSLPLHSIKHAYDLQSIYIYALQISKATVSDVWTS